MEHLLHTPDDETGKQVLHLKLAGTEDSQIAEMIGISVKLLKHHYGRVLNHGIAMQKAKLVKSLFDAADAGSPTVLTHLSKSFLGWQENLNPMIIIPQISVGIGGEATDQNIEEMREVAIADGRLVVGEEIDLTAGGQRPASEDNGDEQGEEELPDPFAPASNTITVPKL